MRVFPHVLLGAALVVSSTSPLLAQAPCDTVSTQYDMNVCASEAAAQSDRRLQSLLQELRTQMDTARFRQLQLVQAKWALYRRAHCDWEVDGYEGGSVAPMAGDYCYRALTEARITELKVFLCEPAGDAGECPASHRYDLPKTPPDTQRRN